MDRSLGKNNRRTLDEATGFAAGPLEILRIVSIL